MPEPPVPTAEILRERPPSLVSQFAHGLGLGGPTPEEVELRRRSGEIAERRATRMERLGATLETEAKERRTLAAEQAEERKRERPAPYELPAAPDLAARAFLSPPQSVLGQLQTVLVGIGQLAQGIGGLKGKGYAIGATAALKGALEGWQAGDQERAQRAFEQWQVETQRLLAAHRSRRERYQDILQDQTRTMQDRLSQSEMDLRIAGVTDVADELREGHLDKFVDWIDRGRTHEERMATLMKQIIQWNVTRQDLQAYRAETLERAAKASERAEELHPSRVARGKLLLAFEPHMLSAQKTEQAARETLDVLRDVQWAVDYLHEAGIVPTGSTFMDRTKAELIFQTKGVGDPLAGKAREILSRFGTSRLIGFERELGLVASAIRIKAIDLAVAGNSWYAPKAFWDAFLPRAVRGAEERQRNAQQQLRTYSGIVSGVLGGPGGEPEAPMREVVEQ